MILLADGKDTEGNMQPPDGRGEPARTRRQSLEGRGGRDGARMGREREAKRGEARRYEAICERGLTTSTRRCGWAGRGGG